MAQEGNNASGSYPFPQDLLYQVTGLPAPPSMVPVRSYVPSLVVPAYPPGPSTVDPGHSLVPSPLDPVYSPVSHTSQITVVPDSIPYGIPITPYLPYGMTGTIPYVQITGEHSSSSHLTPQQEAYQHIPKQEYLLQQVLQGFWANQMQEIENITDFKNQSLPLARIKKIMKTDEDVRMISAEVPVLFARACEMFIHELTLRAWSFTEENKRKTLQTCDIVAAVQKTDYFDFLLDTVSKADRRENELALPTPPILSSVPSDGYPYGYMPQHPMWDVYMCQMYQAHLLQQQQYIAQQQLYIAQQQILQHLEEENEEELEQQVDKEEVLELELELEHELESEQTSEES